MDANEPIVITVRERVTIGQGGVVHLERLELPEGASAEVIVMVEGPTLPETKPLPSLASMVGAAKGLYASAEEVDAYIRAERDAWER